jgi:mannose-6-phosphate isomerase-like protein (cupin superfamily)
VAEIQQVSASRIRYTKENAVQKTMLGFLGFAFIFALAIPAGFRAQMQSPSPHLPRGTATDVNNSEIETVVRKVAAVRVSDQAIRVVSIAGEYNVGVSVVSRLRTSGKEAPAGIEHSQITEIYHVISGNGTLVTGGTLNDPKEVPVSNEVVTLLNGPSTEGSGVKDGVSRKIGPGDVVIIPPNTPHWFSEIPSDKIVYLVIRVDPHRILPAGYVAK